MNEPKPRMKRLCLTLDAFTIAEAKRRGDGNLSLGIRRAFTPPQVRGPAAPESQDVDSAAQPAPLPSPV